MNTKIGLHTDLINSTQLNIELPNCIMKIGLFMYQLMENHLICYKSHPLSSCSVSHHTFQQPKFGANIFYGKLTNTFTLLISREGVQPRNMIIHQYKLSQKGSPDLFGDFWRKKTHLVGDFWGQKISIAFFYYFWPKKRFWRFLGPETVPF